MEEHTRTLRRFLKEEKLKLTEPCMTGLPYLSAEGGGCVIIYLAVRFAGNVDRERLDKALCETLRRFPLAERCILRIGNAFFYAISEMPLTIGDYYEGRKLGGRENGYHSFDISVDEDQVFFAVDHALMDGTALLRIAEYLLNCYDNPEKAGRSIYPAVSSGEEADPYLLFSEGEAIRVKGASSRSFQIPFSSKPLSQLTEAILPKEAVLSVCRKMETSPTAFFALLITEILKTVRPENKKDHIIAEIPIDYRKIPGLTNTMKNAVFPLLADLEDHEWKDLDFSGKSRLLKEKIREAEDVRFARGWIQFYRDYATVWSLMDGHLPKKRNFGHAYTFMLSYLRTSCPECWRGREFLFSGISSHNDFCMTEYGGSFHLWLRPMQGYSWAGMLHEVCAALELPVEVKERKGPSFVTGQSVPCFYSR